MGRGGGSSRELEGWGSFSDRISKVAGRFAARRGGVNCGGGMDNDVCGEEGVGNSGERLGNVDSCDAGCADSCGVVGPAVGGGGVGAEEVEGVRGKVVGEVASATGSPGSVVAGTVVCAPPAEVAASTAADPPREPKRQFVSAGILRVAAPRGAAGAEAKTVLPGGESPVGRGFSAENFCKSGKRFVSAWSQDGTELLIRAADEGLSVAVVRGDRVLWGIPCRYGSYRSGFGLYKDGFLRDFGTTVRMVGGHRVEILSNDLVILASDVKAGAIDVCGVRGETASTVAQVCDCGSSDPDHIDEETMRRRVHDVGKFLYRVGQLKDEVVHCRVESMLFPRVRDVINIVEREMHELVLAQFLRVFLGFNKKSSLQSALDALYCAKPLPRDQNGNYSLGVAVSYANAFLRNCVLSRGTKERGTTFMDHGAVVQIREAKGAEECGCAFLPDLKKGDSGSRDVLFSWHSDVKDSVLPKLDTSNDRMLVSALLFQYYGVPLSDLVIVCHNGDLLQVITAASRRLLSAGLRIIVHNGSAVLGKLGEPATLLADSTDAKAYPDRFASEINCSVDGARKSYEDCVGAGISKRMGVISERSRRRAVNEGIRAFVRAVKAYRSDPVRVKALVDAFVFDRKEAPASMPVADVSVGPVPAESALAESLTEPSVADVSVPAESVSADFVEPVSKPDWIEVVEEVTSELREVHEFAEDIGTDSFVTPVGHNRCYFHGKLLLLALTGMYHGVSRDDIEKLPFIFRINRDSSLDVVIEKVNAIIKDYGIRVYKRGDVLILGADAAGEDRKVQILGKKLPVRMYPKNLVVQMLRIKKTVGVGGGEEVVDDDVVAGVDAADSADDDVVVAGAGEVSACGLGAVDGECAAMNGAGGDNADVGTDDGSSEGVAGNAVGDNSSEDAAVSAGASDETGDKSC